MHGEGTFKFYNMTYEGGFHLNKKHGYGVLTYTTGETYQGQWAADKQSLIFFFFFFLFSSSRSDILKL